jgi:hypothetical protein
VETTEASAPSPFAVSQAIYTVPVQG